MNENEFPKHEAALFLAHNEHRNYYEKAEVFIDELKQRGCCWKDDASQQRAVQTDSIWTLQWYPRTPVTFTLIAAPTLEELLQYAKEIEDQV